MPIKAVIFDLGGVILDSPMGIFAEFEKKHGLDANFLNHLIVNQGPQGAWARLERGELDLESFVDAFDAEIRAAGADISSRELMVAVNDFAKLRPQMIEAVRRIRRAGFQVAALTNNWIRSDGRTSTDMEDLKREFDAFVESSRVGVAKPDPQIYAIALEALGIKAPEAVFLDDIGRNLKPAWQMGMATIKVESEESALVRLEAMLGLALRQ